MSVLFADLVGFTPLSESRDAEEVRELLSRYFDTSRRLVERYGGVVEKFAGDAVMAVWGTPTANEDDAERAVRAGLDLVAAVVGLADERGLTGLRLRVGVVTGEAAVTVGALGEGMVAGDMVNTASRVQAAAEPGTVLVSETTRRMTEAAIGYEDAVLHALKGKAEPLLLSRALRVIAARRGEGRAAGLDPPFVGREREFALVKDLFHATAEERRARLVSIAGVAGIGKTRLSWEFEKYVDGLADDVFWHRGRCLAYGEGVAYWALAEMVRMRARIVEDDLPEVALAKLRESLAEIVRSPEERTLLEPRLAHLLGLADRSAPDKEDLFSAWRIFFERMAEAGPIVLVFEDLQWADAGLLDFVEYLLDWSRSHSIFVLTLARPEISERRGAWGGGQRDFTSLYLEALRPDQVDVLLGGLAPALPDDLRGQIVERAEGVPLYAVETVRMLLDQGALERRDGEIRTLGPIETLAIPETLQALAAARLDALDLGERRLVEDAAVLGKSFERTGLAALSGLSAEELEPLLESLLQKEIFTLQAEPLSPERNQLAFVQDLLRRVSYDTLSLRERKKRHLAAAAHLEQHGDEEIAAVVAAHYLDAYRVGPGDADATELRERARSALTRAAERASSLASAGEAARYFAQAAELTEDPLEQAELLELAGRAAAQDTKLAESHLLLEQAAALLEKNGMTRAAARVNARRAEVFRLADRIEEALELVESSYQALPHDEPDADVALVAAQLARLAFFHLEPERAFEAVEVALEMAEALAVPEVLAEALTTKALLLWSRPHEALALVREAVSVAEQHDLPAALFRARFNLSGLLIEHDRLDEARDVIATGLAAARQRGDRIWVENFSGQLADVLVLQGGWQEATSLLDYDYGSFPEAELPASIGLSAAVRLLVEQDRLDSARSLLDEQSAMRASTDLQSRASYLTAEALVLRLGGEPQAAVAVAEEALELWRGMRQTHYAVEAFVEAAEASLELHDVSRAEALLAELGGVPQIEQRQYLHAHLDRIRGRLAAQRGENADLEFELAAERFRSLGMTHWLAVTLVEDADQRQVARDDEAARARMEEARVLFERMHAVRWLQRLAAASVG